MAWGKGGMARSVLTLAAGITRPCANRRPQPRRARWAANRKKELEEEARVMKNVRGGGSGVCAHGRGVAAPARALACLPRTAQPPSPFTCPSPPRAQVPGWVVGGSTSATGRYIPEPRPAGIWDPMLR